MNFRWTFFPLRVYHDASSGETIVKILIVEDNVMIADLLQESLQIAGFDVCGMAGSTSEAILLGSMHRPDIAVIDLDLGAGGRGTDAAIELCRQWPIGILFASGNGHGSNCDHTGAVAVIGKPYTFESMVAAVMIVHDIATTGNTARPLPQGVRLLHRAPTPAFAPT